MTLTNKANGKTYQKIFISNDIHGHDEMEECIICRWDGEHLNK